MKNKIQFSKLIFPTSFYHKKAALKQIIIFLLSPKFQVIKKKKKEFKILT